LLIAYLRLNCPEGLDLSPDGDQFTRSGLEPEWGACRVDDAPFAVEGLMGYSEQGLLKPALF